MYKRQLSLSGTLILKSDAHIEGEVVVGKLSVEPGATFNVSCVMKGTVKEMNKGGKQQERSETEKTA